MISRFFIENPIFASVISIVIVMAGAVSVGVLPIAQYPEITPPTVEVKATYPGASASVVAETVASPIEQEVIGVENMIYMSSVSASDGSYTLTVTFDVGTDLDMANILVQNRVTLAEPKLPEEVKREGINTKKKSPTILIIASLFSPDGRFDELYMSNYATLITLVYPFSILRKRASKPRKKTFFFSGGGLSKRAARAGLMVRALMELNTVATAMVKANWR